MANYDELKEINRQSVGTINPDGSRKWVFPKMPKGKFHKYRVYVSSLLLIILFGTPFLKMNGEPLFLFNIIERKFILFGAIFWPQDFYIIVVGFLTGVVFIVLFTVIYGRIFCGWVCPQTIFMEMVFRKIEYLIEGDFIKQKKLDKQDWDFEKIWKKGLKHLIFAAMAILISHTFWAYIIGWDEIVKIIKEPLKDHITGFTALTIFSIAFYWVFAFFREQVCIIACPYGRLQGIMLDKNSLTVIYDFIRGEPRGKHRKVKEEETGDCIDCHQCVDVCPTGIDIRFGTQMECINCTACMDACDNIMDMVDKPRGLIRVDSEEGVEKGVKFQFNTRIKAYTAVLVVLIGVLSLFLFKREPIQATVLRSQGQLYQVLDNGHIKNLYKLSLINKTVNNYVITPKLMSHEGNVTLIGDGKWNLESQGIVDDVFFIEIEPKLLKPFNNEIEIGFYDETGKLISTTETKFLAP